MCVCVCDAHCACVRACVIYLTDSDSKNEVSTRRSHTRGPMSSKNKYLV